MGSDLALLHLLTHDAAHRCQMQPEVLGDLPVAVSPVGIGRRDRSIALRVKRRNRRKPHSIRLQPANAEMAPLRFSPEQVQILGVVTAVLRNAPIR